MKKIAIVFCLLFAGTILIAKDSGLPSSIDFFQIKNRLIYFSAQPGPGNTTSVTFDEYDANANKLSTSKVEVNGIHGEFMQFIDVFEEDGKVGFIEFALREKRFAQNGLVVRISGDYKVAYTASYPKGTFDTHCDPAYFEKEIVDIIPYDHYITGGVFYRFEELDARTRDGGMYYLNYDKPDFYPSEESFYPDGNEKINSVLYHYAPESGHYNRKWKLDIPEERITAYRIYLFGKDLFLYTSYMLSAPKEKEIRTEQCIRKIDPQTGAILYETKLEKKDGFEAMLSKVWYEPASGELFISGNYLTTDKQTRWDNATGPLSYFFFGKINGSGAVTASSFELPKREDGSVKKKYLFVPYFKMDHLVRLKNGNFFAAGLLCYYEGEWSSVVKSQSVGTPNQAYATPNRQCVLMDGFFSMVLGPDQKVISTNLSSFNIHFATPRMTMYLGHVLRYDLLGLTGANKEYGLNSSWDPETEEYRIIANNQNEFIKTDKQTIYFSMYASGLQKAFTKPAETNYDFGGPTTAYFIDLKTVIYCEKGNPKKYEVLVLE